MWTSAATTDLKYPFAVIVDDQSVVISITNHPDVFEPDTTHTVAFTIGNLRTNTIEAVEVTASGTGVTSKQTSVFLGTIDANKAASGNISVTTTSETK